MLCILNLQSICFQDFVKNNERFSLGEFTFQSASIADALPLLCLILFWRGDDLHRFLFFLLQWNLIPMMLRSAVFFRFRTRNERFQDHVCAIRSSPQTSVAIDGDANNV